MTLSMIPVESNPAAMRGSLVSTAVGLLPIVGMIGYREMLQQSGALERFGLSGLCLATLAVSHFCERQRIVSTFDALARSDVAAAESPGSHARPRVGASAATDRGDAHRALRRLARSCGRLRFAVTLSQMVWVPIVMAIFGFEGWLRASSLLNWGLAVSAGAMASGALAFYATRERVRVFAGRIRIEPPTPASQARPRHGSPLSQALQIGVFLPGALALILMLNLIAMKRHETAEKVALEWGGAALAAVVEGDRALPLSERIDHQERAQQDWPIAIEIVEVLSSRVGSEELLQIPEALLARLDEELLASAMTGTLRLDGIDEIGAFRRVDGETTLLAYASRESLRSLRGTGAIYSETLLVFGLLCALFGIGFLMRRDLARAFERARASAEAMADDGHGPAFGLESQDELSAIGAAIQHAQKAHRSTREQVASVLDEVDQRIGEVMQAIVTLTEGSGEQAQRLGRANELLVSIDARAREVSQSAEALNDSVADSSSSVAELGAAGAELNQTASVLSEKVDDVSGSMEEMVRSVKRIGATTEKLASASEDTSSSMEEMASAMRVVDTSAETMANLSRDVVEKAEIGRTKVCQTIEGMEAIREATDAAENVIRGLGARTSEIGGILDVIDDVADETNLLALNAAIIAAQAGEQGRAFSVVADEIKELADRVLASTKEIGGLIRSVQEESENAIGAIEVGTQSVMSGVELSAEAGRTLEEITIASRENGMRIGEIVSSVREQTKAAEHVVELMERVRDSTEEIAVASGQQDRGNEVIYRSALTMREVAQQVRTTTEEQAAGFGRISESIEGVRSIVDRIGHSLQEQTGACGEVSQCLEHVVETNRGNEVVANRLEGVMKALLEQTQGLRAAVVRDLRE